MDSVVYTGYRDRVNLVVGSIKVTVVLGDEDVIKDLELSCCEEVSALETIHAVVLYLHQGKWHTLTTGA